MFAPYKGLGSKEIALFLLCLFLTGGCGGGQGVAVGGASKQSGGLTLQILFPQPQRSAALPSISRSSGRYTAGDIPDGSYSVKILLTNPTTGENIVPPRIVTAPVSPNGINTPVTINFAALPVGTINIAVTAHPDTLAQELPLGVGAGTALITSLDTAQVHLPLTLTAKELKTASKIHLSQGDPGRMTALVLNKDEVLIKAPLQFFSSDTSIATVPATGMSGVTILVTAGTRTGSVVITVLEPDSGLTASITFFVS